MAAIEEDDSTYSKYADEINSALAFKILDLMMKDEDLQVPMLQAMDSNRAQVQFWGKLLKAAKSVVAHVAPILCHRVAQ